MTDRDPPLTCGFYGKLPGEADVVSRRLPWEFTTAWGAWLQQGLHAAHEALGPRWRAAYLAAPIWRFQLAEGVCGRAGWRGLFFASVDRVGRHFPFTIAFAGPSAGAAAPAAGGLVDDARAWLALEDAALRVLDPASTVSQVDRVLLALALPGARAAGASAKTPAGGDTGILPGTAPVSFFSSGAANFPPTRFDLPGLPPPAEFVRFVSAYGAPRSS